MVPRAGLDPRWFKGAIYVSEYKNLEVTSINGTKHQFVNNKKNGVHIAQGKYGGWATAFHLGRMVAGWYPSD